MTGHVERVVAADQHPLCRESLATLLRDHFAIDEVAQASDFRHALAALEHSPLGAMLTVSSDLPGMGGAAGLRRLRTDFPSMLLVVFTKSPERDVVLEALCAGAHGCILKGSPSEEIIQAIGSIRAGRVYVPAFLSDLSNRHTSALASVRAPQDALLTDRQFEVLTLVAAGRSNKEIARTLQIAVGTVNVHITGAFRKLGVHNRVSAAAAMQKQPRNDNSRAAALRDLFADDRPPPAEARSQLVSSTHLLSADASAFRTNDRRFP